ncbi:hypothetical protein A3K73_02690 [Candidatus Pacearchaeota archaeon RBG_13_36_9]|nr:MAG: hypothetical protein A3K73_02690 [Candidatus Pacearchaeota archaeon RBG_13_36_9]
MKKRGYLAVLLLILLSLGVISAEEISNCTVLDKENTAYYLSKDILSSGDGDPCIKIREKNITLDCVNHAIGSLNPFGIGVFSESPRTKIQNCIIQDFKKGYGIYLKNSDGSQIVNNVITGNKQGIEFNSNNTKIAYNSISMNQNGANISGKYNVINNNKICYNTIQDVSCGNNQSFDNNYCDSGKVCGTPCIPCTHGSYEVYKCTELNISNSVYLLNTDITVYIQETCFKISAENVTLDCNGHRINSSLKLVPKEKAFLIYSEENYSTIKNCYFESDLKDLRYYGSVIKIENSSYLDIINNSFKSTGNGILLSNYCNSCTVKGSRFNNLNGKGIEAGTLVQGIIQDNKIVSTSAAIKIADGAGCILKDNYIEDSKENAVEIKNNGARVEGNEIISSKLSAIESSSNGAVIKGNTIKNAGLYGIHVTGVSNSSLEGNKVYSASGGIFVEDSENLDVSGNNIGSSSFGFKESSSKELRISGNTFCGNEKDVICESKFSFNGNRCNSKNVCGSCTVCGKEVGSLSSMSLWQRIKLFFEWLF